MKTYSVTKNGNVPEFVAKIADTYNGQPVNNTVFNNLDNDIAFIVVDCGEAHGNTCGDKTAWLADRSGNNSWSVNFTPVS